MPRRTGTIRPEFLPEWMAFEYPDLASIPDCGGCYCFLLHFGKAPDPEAA